MASDGPVTYRFSAEVWRYQGSSPWHFVTLPFDEADEIEERTAPTARGFGAVRVRVTVGSTTWETSLFPDTKAQSYVLPLKQPVRRAEGIEAGAVIDVALEVVAPEAGEPPARRRR